MNAAGKNIFIENKKFQVLHVPPNSLHILECLNNDVLHETIGLFLFRVR